MVDRSTNIPGNQIQDDSIKQDELDITNTPTDGQIIKINMPTGDFTAIDNKPSDLNISGQGAGDFLIFDGTNWVAKGGTELVHVDTFTRDTSLASGTQAITGVGFEPKTIEFLSLVNVTSTASWGFSDGTTDRVLQDHHNTTPDTYSISGIGRSIGLIQASGAYNGLISSFDSDGFTISWTKVSTTSGTAHIFYRAFR